MLLGGSPFGSFVTVRCTGGVGVHGSNGTVDLIVDSELEAFAAAHRFLSYLPSCVVSPFSAILNTTASGTVQHLPGLYRPRFLPAPRLCHRALPMVGTCSSRSVT